MRALRGLTASDIQPRQLTLQWEPLGYNLTRCHTYTLSLCYRYTVPAGASGGNNATVRECLSVERNTSRFTLRDLPPFHAVHVRLALSNPEGKKESREVTFQTEEDSESPEAPPSFPRRLFLFIYRCVIYLPRVAMVANRSELLPDQRTGGVAVEASLATAQLGGFH